MQVPSIYKDNVCQYKDSSRYFYSAMVSSLDHSVERVGCSSEKMNKINVPILRLSRL